MDRVVGPIPDDQVEEVIAKPPAVVIAANSLLRRVIEHCAAGLTTIPRKLVSLFRLLSWARAGLKNASR